MTSPTAVYVPRRDPAAAAPKLTEQDRAQLAQLQAQRLAQLGTRPVHWLRKRR
ncbi:MAG: hypothetical protein ACRDRR_18265 [Pseudonocardiaceae bacterium]